MTVHRDTFRAPDGYELATYRWEPEGEPRAILQLVHGMAEHMMRYAAFAETFIERGFLVHGHEHRGHGHSVPTGERPGHIGDHDGFAKMVGDLHARAEAVKREHPDLPRAIFCHSMGGYVGQAALGQHPRPAGVRGAGRGPVRRRGPGRWSEQRRGHAAPQGAPRGGGPGGLPGAPTLGPPAVPRRRRALVLHADQRLSLQRRPARRIGRRLLRRQP